MRPLAKLSPPRRGRGFRGRDTCGWRRIAIHPADGAPIVAGGGLGGAEGGADNFEIRIGFDGGLDHPLKGTDIEFEEVLVRSSTLKPRAAVKSSSLRASHRRAGRSRG